MTTFTLDLPDELAERLAELPKAEVNAFAANMLTQLVQADDDLDLELDADTIAAIEEGLDDVEAGRTIPFEQVRAEWDAGKASRHAAAREQSVPAAAAA